MAVCVQNSGNNLLEEKGVYAMQEKTQFLRKTHFETRPKLPVQ